MDRLTTIIVTVAAMVSLGGCGMSADMGSLNAGPSGEFGATQGGVQDMTLARELVDEGKVPPADAIIVEAMFSEHDLPVEGEPCDTTLCLRSVMGIAPDSDGEQAAWVQIGMSSTIDPDSFVRPSQTLVATVDVSGSMGWDYVGEGSPGELSRRLLHAIADELTADDRFGIVTFGSSADVALPLTSGVDQDRIHDAIDALGTDGSTNMEAGMRVAFPMAEAALGSTDLVRVMVLSDYQPNVGATTGSEFRTIVEEGSAAGVGMTLFGLGLGLGPEVMSTMSEIRDANAFSMVTDEEVDRVMEDSWPWMVCPIAHDLDVALVPGEGLAIDGSYGFPGEAGDPKAELTVASVFLSRRKGAMLVQLRPTDGTEIASASADISLSYVTPDRESFAESLAPSYDGQTLSDSGKYMPQAGIEKTVALALLTTGMHDAAEAYASDPDGAVAIMESVLERFTLDASEIADPALDVELAFATDLLELMRAGAPQGSFYP